MGKDCGIALQPHGGTWDAGGPNGVEMRLQRGRGGSEPGAAGPALRVVAELPSLPDLGAGTWEVRGCPSRSHRTAGLGLPAATQLQRRSEPMSASVSVITSSHSG